MNVTYPWLMMPLALNYWKDAGYDVTVLPVGGSLQAVQQLVGGGADFVQVNSSVVVQAVVTGTAPLRIVMDNGVIDWGLVVLDNSPIKSVADFKGKKIGVFNLASGGIPYLQAYLRSNGVDPDKDITMIATGYGAPALEALKSGQVAGLMLWAAALAGLENQGATFRYFRGADWQQYPDFALATSQATIDKDPAMVEAIARGAAMATVFALASPECTVKVHWSKFPDTKPTGADDATLMKWDLHNLALQLDTLRWAYELHGSKYYGTATTVEYAKLQDFMLSVKLIDKKVDPATLIINIPNFFEKINNFDVAAVKAQAANCPVK